MRHFNFMPHSLTLLAGAMATLASGQALAETAGKVSFVTGNVTATAQDGQSRALKRGDAINGGDRIETRGGRLQIRFTDGGFVALQPNTVFGVDQYLYANKAPEETSLFFSLLRGGMRTVTGAIGKVNKQSYKVRTPVATIGIRGTGYRATTDNNRTLVSVGTGLVNVENGFGNVTGGAGQNILATNERAPALSREGVELPATGPEGERENGMPEEDDDTPAFGDQLQGDGTPLLVLNDPVDGLIPNPNYIVPVEPSTLQDGPGYTMVHTSFSSVLNGILADFDDSGALQSAIDETTAPAIPRLENVSATVADLHTYKSLSWGRYTNGDLLIDGSVEPLTLSGPDSLHYVIGLATPDATMSALTSQGGTATYALTGYTTPTSFNGAGGSVSGNLTVNFGGSFVTANLAVNTLGVTYNINGSMDIAGPKFVGTSLSTSASDISACSSGCWTDINGFFAGDQAEQAGLTYQINNFANTIKGAATFERGAITPGSPAL